MSTATVANRYTKWAIIILTIITALIHFSRAAADPEISVLFVLNGLGYLALLAAFYAPVPLLQRQHGRIRWLFIAYTLITVIFYFIWGAMSSEWVAPIGPLDKLVEIVLVVLLWRS